MLAWSHHHHGDPYHTDQASPLPAADLLLLLHPAKQNTTVVSNHLKSDYSSPMPEYRPHTPFFLNKFLKNMAKRPSWNGIFYPREIPNSELLFLEIDIVWQGFYWG
jgi:hypothetical protein